MFDESQLGTKFIQIHFCLWRAKYNFTYQTRVVSRANFIPVDRYGRPQKNVPKKQKFKLLTLACLFLKRKFNETHKDFSINYPYNNKCGKTIFSF